MDHIKPLIIAEIGNSHEGSVGIAMSLVDMAAEAGVDLVKFQFHSSKFESSDFEPFRVDTFIQDVTRKQYWDRTSFTLEQWKLIKSHCDSKKVEFLCTPFSIEAAKILKENNLIKRWKIGSGEISNFQLLEYVFGTGLEVLISTGLGSERDISNTIKFIKNKLNIDQLVVMHCVSQYPTQLEFSALNQISHLKDTFGVKVGHSDHSGSKSTCYLALTLPIIYLEVHLTPHKLFFGPDSSSSLTPTDLKDLVEFRNDLIKLKNSNFTRDELFSMSQETANKFRKSLFWSTNLKIGQIITSSNIVVRKPWIGIDASEFDLVVGRVLKKNVNEGSPVLESDFE